METSTQTDKVLFLAPVSIEKISKILARAYNSSKINAVGKSLLSTPQTLFAFENSSSHRGSKVLSKLLLICALCLLTSMLDGKAPRYPPYCNSL